MAVLANLRYADAMRTVKLPQREMHWEAFFAIPTGNAPQDVATRAAIENRGDL